MHDSHLIWRELAASPSIRAAVPHLAGCDLCQQRLLKLAYEDIPLPELPDPLGSSLRAHLELRNVQACQALEIWPRLSGSAHERIGYLREIGTLHHLPMAHILLQDARQRLRAKPLEARVYALFALEILDALEEPAYLVADAQTEAHLVLAEAARRRGDLSGDYLSLAGTYLALGTECPRLSADYHGELASYLVDVGRFAEALDAIDRAVESYREQGAEHSFAVALVKRSAILSFLDPLAGAKDASLAVQWMKRKDLRDQALLAAALASRIDCLLQAGQAQRALQLSTRHHKVLFAEDSTPLFSARMRFLSARLLFRLGLPDEAELALGDAIRALEPLHPQDTVRAKLLLIHHLTRGDRWEEATQLIRSADESLRRALQYPDLGQIWRALALHLLRSEPATNAAQAFLRTLVEAVVRPASLSQVWLDGLGLNVRADRAPRV